MKSGAARASRSEIAEKGGTMKTIAILALLALGMVTAAGCHWGHHRHNRYSDSYNRR
jgi:hypothetical protein